MCTETGKIHVSSAVVRRWASARESLQTVVSHGFAMQWRSAVDHERVVQKVASAQPRKFQNVPDAKPKEELMRQEQQQVYSQIVLFLSCLSALAAATAVIAATARHCARWAYPRAPLIFSAGSATEICAVLIPDETLMRESEVHADTTLVRNGGYLELVCNESPFFMRPYEKKRT
ncbi:hypothetical protein V1511DRAFT_487213 [Dipodascopsis uninucleata]